MLSDADRTEARDSIALALELNEPEALIESLRRMCERKAAEKLIHPNEGNRWKNAADALTEALAVVAAANAPPPRADSPSPDGRPSDRPMADFAPEAKPA